MQASPRTHAQFGGSGLGLYISRDLAELHGGRIGLSTQAGFGSNFEFYIKVRRDQTAELAEPPLDLQHMNMASPAMQQHVVPTRLKSEATPENQAAHEQSSSDSKPTILIVEDNLINQRLLRRLITKNGYDTLAANNGEEALGALSTSSWNPLHAKTHGGSAQRLDMVLCDLEMSVMDGKTCVRRVRQLQGAGHLSSAIPMVAITGNARAEQVQEMKACGFDEVITKPYQMGQLLAVVGKYVRQTARQPTRQPTRQST
ncbi:phosphorelay sensor kinase [Ascochyta rabiei]|uniref:histidine kinase n=2 Tax=Didymella rabiei TaxID=5454 RepID=A0A162VCY3_DIDRA|nr:phosphorelay sensor kinase [Ascochyta rabiei]